MGNIDLNNLTPEQLLQLEADIMAKKKAEKQQKKDNAKTFKQMSGEFVMRHIDNLIGRHVEMENIIDSLFRDYKPILEFKAELYGIDVTSQDSHTSTLPDGSASVTIGHNVSIKFDGTEDAGIKMIRDVIESLGDAGNDKVKKLMKIVDIALKRNAKTGALNPSKIIDLNTLRDEVNDERFDNGLDVIINAQIRTQNSLFVSGWKFIELPDGRKRKIEFRFSV